MTFYYFLQQTPYLYSDAAYLQADDEPLRIGALRIPPAAEASLRRCWQRLGRRSLYSGSFEQYKELVDQVCTVVMY